MRKFDCTIVTLTMGIGLALLLGCENSDNAFGSRGNKDLDTRTNVICSKLNPTTGDCEPYEAEDRQAASGCGVATNHDGFTGSGFMDYGGNGTWIEWNNINAPVEGEYEITFRYGNGSGGNRQASVILNGQETASIPFEPTGSWKNWRTTMIKLTLKQGTNTIRILANTGSGGPNLDHMLVVGKSFDSDDGPADEVENIALGKSTSQSSIAWSGDSARAVDGNLSGNWGDRSITHTGYESAPWWRVDLGAAYRVQSVTLFNRQDCCSNRLSDFHVDLLDKEGNVVATKDFKEQAPYKTDIEITARGVYGVRVQLYGKNYLSLAEVQVFGKSDNGDTDADDAGGTRGCVKVDEHKDANLSCPNGGKITSIGFASYGKPSGSCEAGFEVGNCHAPGSKSEVETACLQKSSCTVKASNSVFGDPCSGTFKSLAVVYTCDSGNNDQCPDDPNKTEPGDCGCGIPEGTCGSTGNIVQHTQEVGLDRPIAPTRRWTYRTSGRCGLNCKNGPRQMYSSSFKNTYLMSWMAIDETLPPEPGEGWVHYGNVSTFSVSENGEFTHISDANFQGACEAVYGIANSSDGSIIALLCKGYAGAELLPGTENLLSTLQGPDCDPNTNPGCYPIGTYNPQGSPLYIFEYIAEPGSGSPAKVTDVPSRIILVNHAVGGANYGHHELRLNQTLDTYFIALKVTNNMGDHEGLKHFGVRRAPELAYVRLTDGWACGGGHIMVNRMAYNTAEDYWSLLCTNDLCAENKQYISWRCHNVTWSTVPGMSYQGVEGAPGYHEGEELLSFETTHQLPWTAPGGAAAIVSLGKEGWLALAPQPSPASSDSDQLNFARSLGLINLPVEATELFDRRIPTQVPIYDAQIKEFDQRDNAVVTGHTEVNRYEWNRVFDYDSSIGEDANARFGSTNLAYFSQDGEESERLLLGWSPDIEFQGLTDKFVVSEIDRQGRLRGEPLVLDGAGWGEDNRWVTMPNSGCVVFPFAWTGDDGPGNAYPVHDAEFTMYPTTIHLTSLCPSSNKQPPVTANPSPWGPAQ